MRSKKLLVAIVTLLLISLTGCGSSNTSETSNPAEASTTQKPSRFSAEQTEIPGTSYHIVHAYIITDNETGKQYLYTWIHEGYAGGASMVEIGNTNTTDTANDNIN